MHAAHQIRRKATRWLLGLSAALLFATFITPFSAYSQTNQTAVLFRKEQEILALVNRERRNAGLPPLRWNRELTLAARGFAQESAERPNDYCGHEDLSGGQPKDRMRRARYTGLWASAENVVCGSVEPGEVVAGWLDSPGHRANMLNGELREAGVGYYRTAAGKGYIVLDLANDLDYAPVVINDEALATTSSQVQLYLYDQDAGDDWQSVGPTREMMIANTPDFAGAAWQPYTPTPTWTLAGGEGWRTVYVKTRDRLGGTTVVQDSIYVGASVPDAALALDYASSTQDGFTVRKVSGGTKYTHIQFSLNWLADDTDENLQLLVGAGERVNDAAATGGTAYRMKSSDGSTVVYEWASNPFGSTPLTAYFRFKIAANGSPNEAVKVSVSDGSSGVATLTIKGTDFAAAGQYQEFAVPFTLPAGKKLLVFCISRSGPADVYWDHIALYTAPIPVASPLNYRTYNGYYRSSGIQARLLTPGQGYSDPFEVNALTGELVGSPVTPQIKLVGSPTALLLSAAEKAATPVLLEQGIQCADCGEIGWQVAADVPWLTATISNGKLIVQGDPYGLPAGVYIGYVTVSVPNRPDIAPLRVQVSFVVGIGLSQSLYLPALGR